MQKTFGYGAEADIARIRDELAARHGRLPPPKRMDPLSQLVRSLIGSRTRDEVSEAAFRRLVRKFPEWTDLLAASDAEVEAAIENVTFAGNKARQLRSAIHRIAAQRADLDLAFLADWPLDCALAWLEKLAGVGPKVAAATLNFSTIERAIFVADTHVVRVLQRYGLIDPGGSFREAREATMDATEGWSAFALQELHVLIKRHGQTICPKPAPRCRDCPLTRHCRKVLTAQRPLRGDAPDKRLQDHDGMF